MKYFLSFGNERFKKSRSRIEKEAQATGLFDSTVIETEEICNEEPFKSVCEKCKICGRGFYWYMWKPYIIYKHLKNLSDGEILFYCDSGMVIPNTNTTKFKFIASNINSIHISIIKIFFLFKTRPNTQIKNKITTIFNI